MGDDRGRGLQERVEEKSGQWCWWGSPQFWSQVAGEDAQGGWRERAHPQGYGWGW